MFNDDVRKLVAEALGDDPGDGEATGVVEKVAESSQSASASESLIGEIDEALGGDAFEAAGDPNEGKIAIAMILAAGDVMAQGGG